MDFNKKSQLASLSFSVLLHLFFLLIFIFVSLYHPMDEIHRSATIPQIPAYVYKEKPNRMIQQHPSKRAKSAENKNSKDLLLPKKSQTLDQSMEVKRDAISETVEKPRSHKSLFASSMEVLRENQFKEMMASQKDLEPIYLLGDLNAPSDPFILLLAKSISANFSYPKLAGEMGVKGKVLVSFIVHPEGYFSNVQLIQSSNNQDLDRAALYAVNKAPTISGLDRFLSQPKRLVVGFIFR